MTNDGMTNADDAQSGADSSFVICHLSFVIHSLAETESLGQRLGLLLFPGAVVALNGTLGAGKTHLTRAIAEGLYVRNPMAVTSPTFGLIHEYPARLPIFHFDAYRLSGPREFAELGSDEYLHGDGVCIIEWAEKIAEALPVEHLRIDIEPLNGESRQFTVNATGKRYERLLHDWLTTNGMLSASGQLRERV